MSEVLSNYLFLLIVFYCRSFWFEKQDFGIHFEPFLGLEYVSDPALVIACPSAMESFRCMFIHLGVGVKVHPFALQVKFRAAAERLLSSNEGEAKSLFTEHLLSVIMSDSYCEMDVLNTVWPSELDGYRIMLVTFQEVDAGSKGFYGFKSIVTYTPESGVDTHRSLTTINVCSFNIITFHWMEIVYTVVIGVPSAMSISF